MAEALSAPLATPSIKAVGIDVAEVDRVGRLVSRYDRRTLSLVFSEREQAVAARHRAPAEAYAVLLAAKEAVGKALGTGMGGIAWHEVEIDVEGAALRVALHGSAAAAASRRCIGRFSASATCVGKLAVATVIAW